MVERAPDRTPDRTNEEWLADLRGPGRDQALADLRAILVRGLRHAMADRPQVTEADLADRARRERTGAERAAPVSCFSY